MDQRLNLGSEVRELKLGSTFNTPKPRTSFHTLKYDFKPASVDISKAATLDVSSNNQVTVTMPHLDSSGVPKTVFKGNQRNYTKECVLIIDKVTGEITLEKLHHNIQVKKTRSENNSKTMPLASAGPSMQSTSSSVVAISSAVVSGSAVASSSAMASSSNSGPTRPSLENSTQRVSSKTRVSTGIRKAGLGGIVQRHSPIQGSPSYPHHKSPQQAPAWNANNGQSTLPSIPMIGMDDDFMPAASSNASTTTSTSDTMHNNLNYHSIPHSSIPSSSLSAGAIEHLSQPSHSNHFNNNSGIGSSSSGIGSSISSSSSSNQNHLNNNSSASGMLIQSNHLHADVGVLTSSDSSDSSDSDNDSASDSGSDDVSDDDDHEAGGRNKNAFQSTSNHMQNNSSHLNQHNNSNLNIRTESLPALLLDEDLRLSESNSSDSDY